jgi:hypothetical protein
MRLKEDTKNIQNPSMWIFSARKKEVAILLSGHAGRIPARMWMLVQKLRVGLHNPQKSSEKNPSMKPSGTSPDDSPQDCLQERISPLPRNIPRSPGMLRSWGAEPAKEYGEILGRFWPFV